MVADFPHATLESFPLKMGVENLSRIECREFNYLVKHGVEVEIFFPSSGLVAKEEEEKFVTECWNSFKSKFEEVCS